MEEWYENITIPDFRIKPTESGYINDKTAFEWLCSFHEASKNRVQKGRPRLLLMDNHGSHTTIEFISFCKEKFIIPFYFLPILRTIASRSMLRLFNAYNTTSVRRITRL
jgi:hypothetical protein